MTLTDAAAKRIQALRATHMAPPDGLRLAVVGGGCSGLSYKFSWGPVATGDKVFEKDGAKLIVDFKSYLYLKGSELDYVETLASSGFKVSNPQKTGECGCGESFST